MEKETFVTRKNFLEDYFKEKISFFNVFEENDSFNSSITFKSNILQSKQYSKNLVKKLKEITYYLHSKFTYEEKILTKISIDMSVPYDNIEEEELNDELLFHDITSVLRMENFYENIFFLTFENLLSVYFDENDFVPYPTKNFNFLIKCKTCMRKKIINFNKCFKSVVCMLCLTNSPCVLFCNCGHISMCVECYKMRSFSECVLCKTKNEIVRILE